MDYTIRLQDGTDLPGRAPIVVLGPNGSGKTRQARTMSAAVPIDFVNALRNTRVSPQIPAMGFSDARNQYVSSRDQARAQHWELTSDFDYLLSHLLAENAMSAMEYLRGVRASKAPAIPPLTALGRVEELWGQIFPGRELFWKDWSPNVRSTVQDAQIEYLAQQMSDGEKAGLYLAGRVLSSDPGIIVVDEPETHLHSLLAVRLWSALEAERPDLRFVYVTHDLTFALSRADAQFVLASPKEGLRALDLGGDLPGDVAEILLGSASLSFYARRVVFCEGSEPGLDYEFYDAWFNGQDTVVRSVGSQELVLRCSDALGRSGVANSLASIGIIDRDFCPESYLKALRPNIHILRVHEFESLLCLQPVVSAVAAHLGKEFDEQKFIKKLVASVTPVERHKIIIERWKRRLEPKLEGLVSHVSGRTGALDDIVADIPKLFDHAHWPFSPEQILKEEKELTERVVPGGTFDEVLALVPGKRFLADTAAMIGQKPEDYVRLVARALQHSNKSDHELGMLGKKLEDALKGHLPGRHV